MAFIERRSTQTTFIPGPHDVMRTISKWMRRRQKRKEIAQLLNMEEWVLKDMGITRADVVEALHKPGDPSLRLRSFAARRRFWARQKDRI